MKNSILADWNIDEIPGFKKIQNPESIQYINEDISKVIYFSILTVSGNDLFTNNTIGGEPTLIEDANGWQLKGAKKSKNQMLICVISVKERHDIEWARVFFNSISPN